MFSSLFFVLRMKLIAVTVDLSARLFPKVSAFQILAAIRSIACVTVTDSVTVLSVTIVWKNIKIWIRLCKWAHMAGLSHRVRYFFIAYSCYFCCTRFLARNY